MVLPYMAVLMGELGPLGILCIPNSRMVSIK